MSRYVHSPLDHAEDTVHTTHTVLGFRGLTVMDAPSVQVEHTVTEEVMGIDIVQVQSVL